MEHSEDTTSTRRNASTRPPGRVKVNLTNRSLGTLEFDGTLREQMGLESDLTMEQMELHRYL